MQDEHKKMSITEFKYWLEGVEEMQTDDWLPNELQWKRIRAKINCIAESVAPQKSAPEYPSHAAYNENMANQPIRNDRPVQMASSGMSGIVAPPPSNPLFSNNPKVPIVTPNIDTASGTYEPPFL